jgi:hypothetical protein
VVDQTGLEGFYDWDLSWTPTPGEPGPRSEPAAAGDGISIFTAIQEQLGLKLESERGSSTRSSSIASNARHRIDGRQDATLTWFRPAALAA